MLSFDEHFRIGVLNYRFGTAGVIVENIDSAYEGPTTRGQDLPRIYMPGSFPGLRQRGAATYTFVLIVSGHTDLIGAAKDPSKTLRQQAHENLDGLRKLCFRDAANNPISLRWYNRPGAEAETYLEAFVYTSYGFDVQSIGQDHFRVVITFQNPQGVWYGDSVTELFTMAAGTPTISNITINPRGNVPTSEVQMLFPTSGAGTTSLQVLPSGSGQYVNVNAAIGTGAPVNGSASFNDLFFSVPDRLLIETTTFPATFNPTTDIKSGLVTYTDQRWLTLGPGSTQVSIIRHGSASTSASITARGAYV